ncbi:MAG TPA: hypothetical protein VIM08_00775 [Arthrobacter sp.]
MIPAEPNVRAADRETSGYVDKVAAGIPRLWAGSTACGQDSPPDQGRLRAKVGELS